MEAILPAGVICLVIKRKAALRLPEITPWYVIQNQRDSQQEEQEG